jgi:hypothetical protein
MMTTMWSGAAVRLALLAALLWFRAGCAQGDCPSFQCGAKKKKKKKKKAQLTSSPRLRLVSRSRLLVISMRHRFQKVVQIQILALAFRSVVPGVEVRHFVTALAFPFSVFISFSFSYSPWRPDRTHWFAIRHFLPKLFFFLWHFFFFSFLFSVDSKGGSCVDKNSMAATMCTSMLTTNASVCTAVAGVPGTVARIQCSTVAMDVCKRKCPNGFISCDCPTSENVSEAVCDDPGLGGGAIAALSSARSSSSRSSPAWLSM